MDALITSLPNFQLREKIRDDDTVDQLHHFVTVYVLIAFAILTGLKEFTGSALDCWYTDHAWKHYQDHANTYCWSHKLYRYPNPSNKSEVPYLLNPNHGGPLDESLVKSQADQLGEINFYRWITVIFIFQAFLFKIPSVVWNECNESSGTQIEKMVSMVGDSSFDTKDKKDKLFAGVAEYVEVWLKINRKPFWFMKSRVGRQTKKILQHCMLCMGANTGNYLSTMYLVVKSIFLLNVLLQFLILSAFLEINFWEYGVRALQIYADSDIEMDDVHFPRVALCHFQVRGEGKWIQCLLTINMLLEKLFLLLWFWMLVLFLLTLYSFIVWAVRILQTEQSVKFVTKYLRVFNEDGSLPQEGKRTVHTFVRDYLGNDGIFMLRILAVNTNDVIMAELVCNIWKRYAEYHYVEPPPEEPEPSVDDTLDEVEMEPVKNGKDEKKEDISSDALLDEYVA